MRVLGDRKRANDGVDRGWIDVHTPNDHQVVDTTEHPAGQQQECPTAGAATPAGLHQIACPIADDGPAWPSEVRQDELSPLAVRYGLQGQRIDDLGDELGFVDVQPQLRLAGIGVGSDLGGARVIPTGGVERALDQRTCRG